MLTIFFVIGVVIGILIGVLATRQKPVGDLRVDHSDPSDGPYLFLELTSDVDSILRKQRVVLRVKRKDFLPHE